MRVLVVNHTSAVSGGERSLLDLIGALPSDISVAAACRAGPLDRAFRDLGIPTLLLPDASVSLRLDVRHTPRGVVDMGVASRSIARQARRMRYHVVHANSVRAGMIASAASLVGAPRPVVHIRDCVPESSAGRVVRHLVNARAAALVANSAYTADAWGPSRVSMHVALGPVDMDRFDPNKHDRNLSRTALGLEDGDTPTIAVLGQITPWKGQDLAIEVTAALRARHPGVVLLVAGEVVFAGSGRRHDNVAYAARLRTLARELGVAGAVRFLGSLDAATVLAASDLLLVPSWEEPMGRVVLEALAMGVPVAATDVGGPAELLNGVSGGVLLPPRRVAVWMDGVEALLDTGSLRTDGARARMRDAASRHNTHAHAARALAVWQSAMTSD